MVFGREKRQLILNTFRSLFYSTNVFGLASPIWFTERFSLKHVRGRLTGIYTDYSCGDSIVFLEGGKSVEYNPLHSIPPREAEARKRFGVAVEEAYRQWESSLFLLSKKCLDGVISALSFSHIVFFNNRVLRVWGDYFVCGGSILYITWGFFEVRVGLFYPTVMHFESRLIPGILFPRETGRENKR